MRDVSKKHQVEPSIAVPDSISHNATLSPASVLVWIGLNHVTEVALKRAGPGSIPSVSIPAVAAWIHCSMATVEYGMMELERVGAVSLTGTHFAASPLSATLKVEQKK